MGPGDDRIFRDPVAAVVGRHVAAWTLGDPAAAMADWSDDGVLIGWCGIFLGRDRIRQFYDQLFGSRADAGIVEPITLVAQHIDGPVTWSRWTGLPVLCSHDMMVIRDGAKVAHTFAAVARPVAEPWRAGR